jgi:hypothetical protein
LTAGRRTSGGGAPNLTWILSPVEQAPLTPNRVVAIVHPNWEGPPPLSERMQPILVRYAMVRAYRRVDLVEELCARNLFDKIGEQDCGAEAWQPTIEQYLEARHSQRSFSRTHLGPPAAGAFDVEVQQALDELCAEGTIEVQDARLQLNVLSRVVWGRPRG